MSREEQKEKLYNSTRVGVEIHHSRMYTEKESKMQTVSMGSQCLTSKEKEKKS